MLQSVERKVECLAKNMYFEARGEGSTGLLAVAHVTLNRTKSAKYPDKVCDVVYQKYQFSWTRTQYRITNVDLFDRIRAMARDVIMGRTSDPTRGATNFHHKSINPGWNCKPTVTIRNHVFCR